MAKKPANVSRTRMTVINHLAGAPFHWLLALFIKAFAVPKRSSGYQAHRLVPIRCRMSDIDSAARGCRLPIWKTEYERLLKIATPQSCDRTEISKLQRQCLPNKLLTSKSRAVLQIALATL